jgi:hypothetical protein
MYGIRPITGKSDSKCYPSISTFRLSDRYECGVSPPMSSFKLHASVQERWEQFKLLTAISAELGSTDKAEDDLYIVGWIEDQFARIKMCAGNIGAFADGHASLDYRLRDNEQTQEFMLGFW